MFENFFEMFLGIVFLLVKLQAGLVQLLHSFAQGPEFDLEIQVNCDAFDPDMRKVSIYKGILMDEGTRTCQRRTQAQACSVSCSGEEQLNPLDEE